MTRTFPAISALLFLAALGASVFFQGFETFLFSLSLSLLLLWFMAGLWAVPETGRFLSLTPLALGLTLFWIWLGAALFWTRVLYVSVSEFWWMGALPIAFWGYLLSARRDALWPRLSAAIVLLGAALALYAIYQFFVLDRQPASTFLNANSHAALLNLIVIPLAAHLLASYRNRSLDGRRIILGILFFVLVFAVALTKGRAAAVTLIAGLVLVAGVAYRSAPRRALFALVGLTAVAYLLAAVSWQGTLTSRFAELHAPLHADSMQTRLQIWEATWRMIQDAPWWGAGSGLFSLLYPSYRQPQESSAGFLVHNDYLQLWLEAGLPGLMLLLAAMISVGWMFICALRARRANTVARLEMTGLFAGLSAIAVHSVVDFNLHVLTILMVAGVALARFQDLVQVLVRVRQQRMILPSFLSVPVYRTLLIALVLFPLLYFATITLAVYENGRAQALVQQGQLNEADRAFRRAYRYYPTADNVLVNHADLYRHILTLLPRDRIEERREVFHRAREFLDKAEQLNKLRPLSPLVRASLYDQNRDLVSAEAQGEIEAAYRRALELNPRFYAGRLAYAKFLSTAGRYAAARDVAEDGLRQFYLDREELVPYLAFVARLRRSAGDHDGARELGPRIQQALLNSGWVRVQRPEEAKPLAPAGTASH